MAICVSCGDEFEQPPHHPGSRNRRQRKTCSRGCANSLRSKTNAAGKPERVIELIGCPVCGTPFDPRPGTNCYNQYSRKTCSPECGSKLGARGKPKNSGWTSVVPDTDRDLYADAELKADRKKLAELIIARNWMRALHEDRERRNVPERGLTVREWERRQAETAA